MNQIPEWRDNANGSFDWTHFFSIYWQKKPVVIRNFMSQWPQITADELAGFALEEDTETRIIEQREHRFQLQRGPFTENQLQQLQGDIPWTLLVQGVDQWLPAFAQWRDLFLHLPAWRFDDIMVSFACNGGGVGPHLDDYDVFLLQAQGSRRWRISLAAVAEPHWRADCDTKVLAEFAADAESMMQPGDLLYLPPQFAHDGIAEGDAMTYSVGWYAPTISELAGRLGRTEPIPHHLDQRFTDPWRTQAANPYELTTSDQQALNSWLKQGELSAASPGDLAIALTIPRGNPPQFEGLVDFTDQTLPQLINEEATICRDGSIRILYFYSADDHRTHLVAHGQTWELAGDLRPILAKLLQQYQWPCKTLPLVGRDRPSMRKFYDEGLRQGWLYPLME